MAMKEWFRRMRPVQLYVMLAMTTLFFLAQLVMSHMAHALTLLVDSCHMLCNLIALTGCIITIKYGSTLTSSDEESESKQSVAIVPKDQVAQEGDSNKVASTGNKHQSSACSHTHHHAPSATERRLRNTFGWARIDVLVMLICGVFLASLCFSLVVEALQELVHIDHHDEMHHPIAVMCVGAAGLLLNGLCYLLIGGYTFHQGSFLHVTASGEVVLDHSMHQDALQRGQRRLSKQTRQPTADRLPTPRQGFREMFRDVVGCLFVIVCSAIVYFTDQSVAKFVDPILSIVSAIVLLVLSYPYMKEAGAILLQTIPDHINIAELRSQLIREFPDIVNVHDLHVWQLTQNKVFSTVHIIFLNPKDYARIILEVTNFFYNQGITQVTIQPEFFKTDNTHSSMELLSVEDHDCLVKCSGELCHSRHCCSHTETDLMSVVGHGHSHGHGSHSHGHGSHSHNNGHSHTISQVTKSSLDLAPSSQPPITNGCQNHSLPPPSKPTMNDLSVSPPPVKPPAAGDSSDEVVTGQEVLGVTECKGVLDTETEITKSEPENVVQTIKSSDKIECEVKTN